MFVSTLCFLILVAFAIITQQVQSDPRSFSCGSNTTIYNPNSTYQANLRLLLTSLSSDASRNSVFFNNTVGVEAPNVAYGLYLCRGDLTDKNACHDCVETAAGEIVTLCPNQKGAMVWYDDCMLRYTNRSMFSIMEDSPRVAMWNTENMTDQSRFQQVLGETLDELAIRASRDGFVNDQHVVIKGFAFKEVNFTSLQKLYALVQCTPDIRAADCERCLRSSIALFQQYSYGKQGGTMLYPSCNARYEIYPFFNVSAAAPPPSPPPISSPPSTPPPSPTGKRQMSSRTIVAIVAPICIFLLLLVIGFSFLARMSKHRHHALQQTEGSDGTDLPNEQSLQFDLATIEAATNVFSAENKIGEGGFGAVYKGVLPNGQEIAVKRLSKSSGQGSREFKNEVILVAKLQHRNLVRLLGFCLEAAEKILIYEYVPNKSLDCFLFVTAKQGQLDWLTRYKIIGGIARGILYLHEDSRLRIIHRDLKASNILLDEDMNAKISDFGMARIFGVDQSQENTSRIVGTFGYMAPEYAMHGHFSMKSDVFSFGVLVLEIISGKKNTSFYQSDRAEDLLSFAWRHWKDGTPLGLMDPSLMDSYSRNEVIRLIIVGLLCVQEDVDARPSMASVVLMLNSNSVTLPLPQKPPFFAHSKTESNIQSLALDKSTSKSITASVDDSSITEVLPR